MRFYSEEDQRYLLTALREKIGRLRVEIDNAYASDNAAEVVRLKDLLGRYYITEDNIKRG